MSHLSMTRLRNVAITWPVLFALAACGTLYAQTPDEERGKQVANFANLQQAAASEAESGDLAGAIRDTKAALQIQPEWKEGWWNLGTLQYEANQYRDATDSFQKVVGYAPKLGTAWALLGLCEFELKEYPPALSHLEQAQTLGFGDDPQTARVASYHLALLLIRAGDFERGANLLRSAFGDGTPPPQVQLALGLALLRIPLLPDEIDPSKDALVRAAGDLASSHADALARFPDFLEKHAATPFAHYAYGLRLKAAGKWSDALIQQREETKISPRSPLPWAEISELEAKLGHPAEASSAAQQAKALTPENAEARAGAAREQRIIALYSGTGSSPDRDQTAADQTAAMEGWKAAMQDYSAGRYVDAISALKPWLQSNPSDGTSWAVLGLSEFALKDYDNAQIHLERGEQLGLSGSAESVQKAKYTLGLLLIRSGEFDRAAEILTSAAGPGPLQGEVRFASGLALLRIPKLPDQVRATQSGLIMRAGTIAQLLAISRYDEADPEFQALLKQYPATPFLHYAYGTALLALSQYQEARAQMQAETRISPQSELPYVRIASIALRQQQPADAVGPAERAVQLNTDSAEAHYLLGRAALELGDTTRSVRELEIACRLAPSSPEAHFNLAKAYMKSGQPQKAEEERARFSELNSIAEARRRQGSQVYQGPHDAAEISGTQKPAANSPN